MRLCGSLRVLGTELQPVGKRVRESARARERESARDETDRDRERQRETERDRERQRERECVCICARALQIPSRFTASSWAPRATRC